MAIFNLLLDTGRLASPIFPAGGTAAKLVTADNLINTMRQLASGGLDPMTLTARVTPVAATGTITLSSASGTLTATINGVGITSSGAGTDTEDAVAMAAAINASVDALVAGFVTATSALGVVTITAANKGLSGNAITTAGSGTGVTADQARLTGGTNGTVTSYTY